MESTLRPTDGRAGHKKDSLPIFFSLLCVAPVPQAAQLFAESGSAPVPMFSQEPLDPSDILDAQFPALYDYSPSSAGKYFLCLPCAEG